jgi:hypothetical protein
VVSLEGDATPPVQTFEPWTGHYCNLASVAKWRERREDLKQFRAPSLGAPNGGTAVTILGVDFMPGSCTAAQMSGVTSVYFSDTNSARAVYGAQSVVVVNDTTITAITPSHPPGPVSFGLYQAYPPCAGGQRFPTAARALLPFNFISSRTTDPPTISLSPARGLRGRRSRLADSLLLIAP